MCVCVCRSPRPYRCTVNGPYPVRKGTCLAKFEGWSCQHVFGFHSLWLGSQLISLTTAFSNRQVTVCKPLNLRNLHSPEVLWILRH